MLFLLNRYLLLFYVIEQCVATKVSIRGDSHVTLAFQIIFVTAHNHSPRGTTVYLHSSIPYTHTIFSMQIYGYVSNGVILTEIVVWAGKHTRSQHRSSQAYSVDDLYTVISAVRASVACSSPMQKWMAATAVFGFYSITLGINIYVLISLQSSFTVVVLKWRRMFQAQSVPGGPSTRFLNR